MYIKYNFQNIVFGYLVGIIIFILTATSITMYSLGYRLNIHQMELEKTGIIRLNPITVDSKIFLNDIEIPSNIIETTTEISDLKPGDYDIRVIRQNYSDWKKKITVLPNQITNIYDIILIPENPKNKEISYINNFAINEKYQQVAYTANNTLQIFNFLTEKIQTANNIKINNSSQIVWINDELLAIINSNPEETSFQILNPFNNNISNYFIKKQINADDIIGTIPLQESNIIFYSQNSLYTVNITNDQSPQSLVENIYSPFIKSNNLYYLPEKENSNKITVHNLILNTISFIQLPIQANTIKPITNSDFVYLINNDKSYLLDLNNPENYQEISPAKKILLSNNTKKIAVLKNQEISIIDPTTKQSNTLLRLSTDIESIIWLDSTNLIYSNPNQLSRIDTDGDNLNIIEEQNPIKYDMIFANQQKILVITNINEQQLLKIITIN